MLVVNNNKLRCIVFWTTVFLHFTLVKSLCTCLYGLWQVSTRSCRMLAVVFCWLYVTVMFTFGDIVSDLKLNGIFYYYWWYGSLHFSHHTVMAIEVLDPDKSTNKEKRICLSPYWLFAPSARRERHIMAYENGIIFWYSYSTMYTFFSIVFIDSATI